MSSTTRLRKKIECPVSSGVLHDLYWGERKNLNQIAEHLHERGLTTNVVSWGKVRAWFNELGVPVANPKQSFRRGLATKREKYGSVSKILQGRSWSMNGEQKRRLSVIRKGKKLGSSTPEQLGHPEIECACCSVKFRRSPSGVRQSFRHGRQFVFFFCSSECRKKGARFSDTTHADAVYFSTRWYADALAKARGEEAK